MYQLKDFLLWYWKRNFNTFWIIFIKYHWEDNSIFKRRMREIIFVVYFLWKSCISLWKGGYRVHYPSRKASNYEEKSHVTAVHGLIHQLMCQVRLGCLLHYHGCSCLCCFSGAGFSGSPQQRSCKQLHKNKESFHNFVLFCLLIV